MSGTSSSLGSLDDVKKLWTWPSALAETVIKLITMEVLMTTMLCSSLTTVATCFSGLGTVEQGLSYFKQAASELGLATSYCFVAATDQAAKCRNALLQVCDGCCVYDDVLNRTKADKNKFRKLCSVGDRIAYMRKQKMARTGWCHRHHKQCKYPKPTVEVAGSPCPAHSRIGLRRGGLADDFICLLSWAAFHIKHQTPLLVHENVVGFALDLMKAIFGKWYFIVRLRVSTDHAGYGGQARRDRVYDVLAHRKRARIVKDIDAIYKEVVSVIGKTYAKPG